jgi:hypothetical protein
MKYECFFCHSCAPASVHAAAGFDASVCSMWLVALLIAAMCSALHLGGKLPACLLYKLLAHKQGRLRKAGLALFPSPLLFLKRCGAAAACAAQPRFLPMAAPTLRREAGPRRSGSRRARCRSGRWS